MSFALVGDLKTTKMEIKLGKHMNDDAFEVKSNFTLGARIGKTKALFGTGASGARPPEPAAPSAGGYALPTALATRPYQADPDGAELLSQKLKAHADNLLIQGEVCVRFFVDYGCKGGRT